MTYEVRAHYTRGFGYTSVIDRECSVPKTEITSEQAEAYMQLIKSMGGKRHETETQIFYDLIEDSNHSKEIIFYK